MAGIYIHVPFCDGKCPYCDFYSLRGDADLHARYTAALVRELQTSPYRGERADTVYFGGGTPNLLGAEKLAAVLAAVQQSFPLAVNAEVTVEVNPTRVDQRFFDALARAGVNRLSVGLQSADAAELRLLGRRHSLRDVDDCVRAARTAGITNISIDLMLALPGMTEATIAGSIDYAADLGVQHVSAYLLKIEEGTPFFKRWGASGGAGDDRRQADGLQMEADSFGLPTDDTAADQYLFAVDRLAAHGFQQYEISNFSLPGFAGRHNLNYWRCGGYLGFGPSAHSCMDGRRFYHAPDLNAYLKQPAVTDDGPGGGFEEYAMLALRLTDGVRRADCRARFPDGEGRYLSLLRQAKKCPPVYLRADDAAISLTPVGFAVSNAVILTLLGG